MTPNTSSLDSKTKKKFFHMLLWQSRPSCSNYMPRFGEAVLWCSTACGDAKVFLCCLCHHGVSQRRLGPIFERRRLGRGVHTFGVEVVHFAFYLAFSFFRQWLASSSGIDVPAHTRSRSTMAWTRASQGSRGRALFPSGSSSSLSSSLDVTNASRPTSSHHLLPLLARSRGMRLAGSPRLPTNGLGHLLTHTWQLLLHSSITPAHSKSPSSASLSLMTCCRMIWSTPICSLKLSSQSKWRHPTANAPKNYVSTFIYCRSNVP